MSGAASGVHYFVWELTMMADQGDLTYTGLCYGGDGQSWCLSNSQGPAKGTKFPGQQIGCLPSASRLACVEVEKVQPSLVGCYWKRGTWPFGSSLLTKLLTECSHRALKTRGNTPKYGLIFHSTFIGRAAAKNKGRISRYLANKCSIASRIDCFSGMDGEAGV